MTNTNPTPTLTEAARTLCDARNSTEARVNALRTLDGDPTDPETLAWYRDLEADPMELDTVAYDLWNDGEYPVPFVSADGTTETLED